MIDLRELIQKISQAKDKLELQNIKSQFLGKNSQINQEFKKLGSLSEEEKKIKASSLNNEKQKITEAINNRFKELEKLEISKKLQKDKVDVTLPARERPNGKIHPVSQVIDEISSIFSEIGFSVAEGPDVETEYNNFTALNTPEDHPARDMHDTFYLDNDKKILLRTHTSPVQVRTMLNSKPPFKIIVPGRTYRCDSDQTHAPMFHQL
jgi:phenylalanyl-tRNA synthetase alpha chain